MAWQDEMVLMLRAMVDDLGEAPRFSDARLEQLLVVAAQLTKQDATFQAAYETDVAAVTITPDPTTTAPRDDWFVNLVTARAACLMDQGAAAKGAGRALRVRELDTELDMTQTGRALLDLLSKGACAVYRQLLRDYLTGNQSGLGAAVMGPYRLYSQSRYHPWTPYKGR